MMKALLMVAFSAVWAQAQSYLVVDADSGRMLASEGADKKRPIASVTKLAMACVVEDWITRTGASWQAVMTVPASVDKIGGGNPLALQEGDRLTIESAFRAALIASDNRSAHTLASYVGWQLLAAEGTSGDAVKRFVQEMNALAVSRGMTRTKFVNAHGMDTRYQRGKSTASDVMHLCQYARAKPMLMQAVGLRTVTVRAQRGTRRQAFRLSNTNDLLGKDGYYGMKTGMTGLAGGCLTTICTRGGRTVLCVVLGSEDRFGLTQALVNQGFSNM